MATALDAAADACLNCGTRNTSRRSSRCLPRLRHTQQHRPSSAAPSAHLQVGQARRAERLVVVSVGVGGHVGLARCLHSGGYGQAGRWHQSGCQSRPCRQVFTRSSHCVGPAMPLTHAAPPARLPAPLHRPSRPVAASLACTSIQWVYLTACTAKDQSFCSTRSLTCGEMQQSQAALINFARIAAVHATAAPQCDCCASASTQPQVPGAWCSSCGVP